MQQGIGEKVGLTIFNLTTAVAGIVIGAWCGGISLQALPGAAAW